MGKVSVKKNKSIYQVAREELGYSRAQAAEMMDHLIPEYRLVKLEDGTAAIHPEDVCQMAAAYNKPELRNYYCTHQCQIGQRDIPEVIYQDNVHEILVNMAVSLESANQNKIRLMEMLKDGKIDATESADLNTILDELEKISMTIEAIQFWCEKAGHKGKK